MLVMAVAALGQPGSVNYFNNWHLGDGVHLALQTGAPPSVGSWGSGTLPRHTISDPVDGSVLFSFDPGSAWSLVYDASGQSMPNGVGHGGFACLPHPGDLSVFYIFSLSNDSLYYSTVDLSLNNGAGDVVGKTLLNPGPFTYLATAFSSNDGLRHTLLLHARGTNDFRMVTCTTGGAVGIGPAIPIGPVIGTEVWPYAIRVSPTNSRVAFIGGDWMSVWLMALDADAGTLSQPVELNFTDSIWSVEFSPSGELLYMSDMDSWGGLLFQMEIGTTNSAAILASIDTLDTWPWNNAPFWTPTLQLGNDGVIHIQCGAYTQYWTHLQAITQPDVQGAGCGLDLMYTDLQGALPYTFGEGFPWQYWPRTTANSTSERPGPGVATFHPNPSAGQGWLRVPEGFRTERVMWTDATGRTMDALFLERGAWRIWINNGPTATGVYHLTAFGSTGERLTVRVSVE